jgi:hypothetical protein
LTTRQLPPSSRVDWPLGLVLLVWAGAIFLFGWGVLWLVWSKEK